MKGEKGSDKTGEELVSYIIWWGDKEPKHGRGEGTEEETIGKTVVTIEEIEEGETEKCLGKGKTVSLKVKCLAV